MKNPETRKTWKPGKREKPGNPKKAKPRKTRKSKITRNSRYFFWVSGFHALTDRVARCLC